MKPAVEVLHLPTQWVLAHYRSSEAQTWEETRADFTEHHIHVEALTADIRAHGDRTPLQLDPIAGKVRRGHHRLLAAADAGVAFVPVMFAYLDESTWWDPSTGTDVPRDDDTEDDDGDDAPWEDRVYPVPAAARAVAHAPVD